MKPLLIVNPRSARGKTGIVFEKMRGPIERHLGHVDVMFTERPQHAVDIARSAALDGRGIVVAVGGDGSIHEVACGLMHAREQGDIKSMVEQLKTMENASMQGVHCIDRLLESA